jgi:hypothetical protein
MYINVNSLSSHAGSKLISVPPLNILSLTQAVTLVFVGTSSLLTTYEGALAFLIFDDVAIFVSVWQLLIADFTQGRCGGSQQRSSTTHATDLSSTGTPKRGSKVASLSLSGSAHSKAKI